MKQKQPYKDYKTDGSDKFIEALMDVDFNNRTAEFKLK